jgi:serine protease Do
MPSSSTALRRCSRLFAAAALAALIAGAGLAAPPAVAQTPSTAPAQGFGDLVEKVMPAVVSVDARIGRNAAAPDDGEEESQPFALPELPPDSPFRQFFDQFPRRQQPSPHERGVSQGSGFIISSDGYVVTNNHVVQGAEELTVRTNTDEEFTAKVVGTDPKTDLALLKIESGKPFAFVSFAKKEPRVGDWVIAVGNPFGLGGTVTTGIISARGRNIGSGPYDDFLQIDAPIIKGNSGGPAFNLDGEVIGINTAIFSPSGGSVGIGFAIPAYEAVHVIDDLREMGAVTRGWLGVQIQPITDDIAESVGLKSDDGALVADVTPNSPALKAGLRTGDAIVMLNGAAVKDPSDLSKRVARLEPGQDATLTVMREGAEKEITFTVGKMPGDKELAAATAKGDAPVKPVPSRLGLSLEPAPDGRGVLIAGVAQDSPAAAKGLKPGDVILQVGGADVDEPAALSAAIEEAVKNGQKHVLCLVRTGDRQRFVAIPTSAS